jgi:hypothetical protein
VSAHTDICKQAQTGLYCPGFKGIPVARRGRKASGLLAMVLETAGLPVGRQRLPFPLSSSVAPTGRVVAQRLVRLQWVSNAGQDS